MKKFFVVIRSQERGLLSINVFDDRLAATEEADLHRLRKHPPVKVTVLEGRSLRNLMMLYGNVFE